MTQMKIKTQKFKTDSKNKIVYIINDCKIKHFKFKLLFWHNSDEML